MPFAQMTCIPFPSQLMIGSGTFAIDAKIESYVTLQAMNHTSTELTDFQPKLCHGYINQGPEDKHATADELIAYSRTTGSATARISQTILQYLHSQWDQG
jgi:hypothetical protein